MKEQFLINDINNAQIHKNLIEDLSEEIKVYNKKNEFEKTMIAAKEIIQSSQELTRMQKMADELSKRGVKTEVVHYVR